jgi:hypothetical protein
MNRHREHRRTSLRGLHAFLPATLVLAALACADADPVGLVDGALSVRVSGGGLLVENLSAVHPIGVVPIDESVAAVIDLAPCDTWETVPPGRTRAVPFDEILGWSATTEWVLVYWCHQVGPADGGGVRVGLSGSTP